MSLSNSIQAKKRRYLNNLTLVLAVLMLVVAGGYSYRPPVATGQSRHSDVDLLARVVSAEAQGEPYSGQVAVAAVILNRVDSSQFPNTLNGVVFQPHAFESVSNGLIWRRQPTKSEISAARDAINGKDPTYGCLFFWNPSKPVSNWIWSRKIAVEIGSHVFAN